MLPLELCCSLKHFASNATKIIQIYPKMIKVFPLEMKGIKCSMIVIKTIYVLKFKIFGQYSIVDKVQKKIIKLQLTYLELLLGY